MHFCAVVARVYSRVSFPRNVSLNWFMPALVKRSVGSSCGTSGELGTMRWPFFSKYFRKEARISLDVIVSIVGPRAQAPGLRAGLEVKPEAWPALWPEAWAPGPSGGCVWSEALRAPDLARSPGRRGSDTAAATPSCRRSPFDPAAASRAMRRGAHRHRPPETAARRCDPRRSAQCRRRGAGCSRAPCHGDGRWSRVARSPPPLAHRRSCRWLSDGRLTGRCRAGHTRAGRAADGPALRSVRGPRAFSKPRDTNQRSHHKSNSETPGLENRPGHTALRHTFRLRPEPGDLRGPAAGCLSGARHIGGRRDALDFELELVDVGGPAERLFVGDVLLLVQAEDGLVERLHSVLRRALRDRAVNEVRFLLVEDAVAQIGGADQDFHRRHAPFRIGPRNHELRDHRPQYARQLNAR